MCIIVDPSGFRHLWMWFQDSAIREVSYPIPLFHGTCSNINKFRPFSHFGTLAQAKTRWAGKFQQYTSLGLPNMYTAQQIIHDNIRIVQGKHLGVFHIVALRIERPLLLNDPGEDHTLNVLTTQLREARILDKTTHDTIRMLRGGSTTRTIQLLLARSMLNYGVDGIQYVNNHESRGCTSYIIIDPWQVAPFYSVSNSIAIYRNESVAWQNSLRARTAYWAASGDGLV